MKFNLLIFAIILLASSCTINKNLMFKTDTEYVFQSPPDTIVDYKITINDEISFFLFSNDGTPIINNTSQDISSSGNQFRQGLTYTVDLDGNLDLPELGLVNVDGLTVYEAQDKMEGLYEFYHVKPFVKLEVVNKRVIIFPGSGGDARTITLTNGNTNVIEALALAGGIADRGDASKVKLIRTIGDEQQVFLMDLSTIEGIQYAQMYVQSNDVIYVEPVPEIAKEVLKDAAPVVSLISSFAVIWAVLTRINTQ